MPRGGKKAQALHGFMDDGGKSTRFKVPHRPKEGEFSWAYVWPLLPRNIQDLFSEVLDTVRLEYMIGAHYGFEITGAHLMDFALKIFFKD